MIYLTRKVYSDHLNIYCKNLKNEIGVNYNRINMGNNIALDGTTESEALHISQEIEFTSADEFLREVLTRIGAGRYKYEPQQIELV